jgi:ribosomal protein S21
MALEVKKQERETSQSLVRRFTKRIQQSGILLRARKIRFREREKSRQMKKRMALRKEIMKKEYEKLSKLGKIEKQWNSSRKFKRI